MKSQSNTYFVPMLHSYVKATSLVAVGTGLAVLLGWVLDITALKSVLPGLATMKVNAAIAFILLGISLWLLRSDAVPFPMRRIGQVFAGLVLVIGLLTLSEYLFGWDLGIDQILFKDLGSPESSYPGRMSLIAAFLFSLSGLAVLLINFNGAQYLFIGTYCLSLLAIVGYSLDFQSLYNLVGYASTAVHTAVLFFILSIGFLAARPTHGVMKVFTSNLPGSNTMRLLLLSASALPILLGWFVERGEDRGFFDARNDTVVLITLLIFVFSVLTYVSARALLQAEGQISYQARLLQQVNDAIIVIDDQFRITTWNRAAEVMYGWNSQEVMGRNVAETLRFELSDEQQAGALEQLKEHTAFRGETIHHRKDGQSIYVESNTIALTGEHEQITGFASVNRDITKRKQVDEALRLSEERLRLLTESIPQLVWSARADGVSDYYNAPFLQYLGKTLEEMQGWVWVETLHPDDRERSSAMWTQAFSSGSNYEIEYRIRRAADGQYRWHLGRAVPLRDSSAKIVRWYGTCTDIHDRKQAEEEIRQHVARMETLARRLVETREAEQRAIGRELHDEIGQVLTGLRFSLQTSASLQLEEKQVYVTMINDLISRLRNISIDLHPTMLDHLGLLPTLLWHIDKFSQQTKIVVDFQHSRIDQRFAPEIEISAFRIIQEALTNAARHAHTDHISMRMWTHPGSLQIQIEDRGVGFDVNGAVDSYKTSGLIGMHERAMALGGTLAIESVPGAGTRLYVELPLNDRSKEDNDDPNPDR